MGHITPEEKEKIIQLFNTQEVDNLLLVYNLLQGFGINILDCDWLIRPFWDSVSYKVVVQIQLPLCLEVYTGLEDTEKQILVCKFYSWALGMWDERYETSSFINDKFQRFEYLDFSIPIYDTNDNIYLEFISEVKDIQNNKFINL